MNRKRVLAAFVSVLIGLVGVALVATAEEGASELTVSNVRYVAPGGTDDGNDCDHSEHPCATLQHAVDVAYGGDDVRVAAGTYTGTHSRLAPPGYSGSTVVTQMVYISKTITVRGGYSSNFDRQVYTTTLDAEGQGRVLLLVGDITPTLEALYITGGDATGLGGIEDASAGGGVYVLSATTTLNGCHIATNTAFLGGGVFMYQSDGSTLSNNTIRDNVADYAGGGVYLELSPDATLKDNVVQNNTAYAGGGIGLVSSAHATLQGNVVQGNAVSGNSASLGGGIALVLSDNAVLSDNVIQGNVASVTAPSGWAYGGGIYQDQNANVTLSRNAILSNTADYGGGVLVWHAVNATLSGNTLLGNVAEAGGGILLWNNSNATLDNNVIADNWAGIAGSGIYILASTACLRHDTLARNTGSSGLGVSEFDGSTSRVTLTNTVLVSHTTAVIVAASSAAMLDGVLWYGNGTNSGGAGSLVVTHAISGNPAFAADGYHLMAGSAAQDNGVMTAGVLQDIDGEPRFDPPDLGADEYWPPGVLRFVYLPLILKDSSSGLSFSAPATINPRPAESIATAGPVLYFSDLASGPKTGNSDTSSGRSGQDGAIVTVWGRNLGSSRGSGQVFVNGAEAASYYAWDNATAPADLYTYHQMQQVSFQVSHLAQDGPGAIHMVVNGRSSNTLPFTVRAGAIYFVAAGGSDDTGDGSWSSPWRTIPHAASSLAPGDVAYVGDGVDQTAESNYGAAVNLGSDGTEGAPKALVVYPGATSHVGNTTIERAFGAWNPAGAGSYSVHWTLAKFTITTGGIGVAAQSGFRVVGNYVTAPDGDGWDGVIDGVGNNLYILGNELDDVGDAQCQKYYHAIYLKGVRQDDPPRAPTESNREVGWNYIHDSTTNRAINIYSEQDYSAFIQQHRIHDNVIVNQHGDGILLGYYVTGDNWVYNNLVINAGGGPEWVDDQGQPDPSYHTGLHLVAGHEEVAQTRLYVYNNTLYGNGWSGATWPEQTGAILVDQGMLERSTTVYFSNNVIYSTGEPYLAGESAALPAGDYRNCWYGDGDTPAWDTTAINDDPDFVGAGAFNFQLQESSPCRDTGQNVAAVVARDLLGAPRPQGLAFDVGAYEYVTGTLTLQPRVYLPFVAR